MHDVVPLHARLAPSTPEAIDKVRQLTEVSKQLPHVPYVIEHMLHAGMYTRTTRLPPNTVVTAALIKVPTVLIIVGACRIYHNDELIDVAGYTVFPGSAGRKIAFVTQSEVAMSMMFPSKAKTREEAEQEFTDEYEQLVADKHVVLITGE